MHQLFTFKNGFKLIVVPYSHLRSVTVGIWVNTGSCQESKRTNGISHFIEHMLFKGTDKKSAFEIADFSDRLGAHLNAFTSKEFTCYHSKSIDEHLESCLSLLSELYFDSVFDGEEMAREKGVVLEEISASEDTPEDLCLELLSSEAYRGSPLGMTVLGSKKTVSAMTREDIKKYMSQKYTANNTVAVVCGNVEPQEVRELADKYFASRFEANKAKRIEVAPHSFTGGRVCKSKRIEQANIGLSFPAFNFGAKQIPATTLVSNLLGGCMSSRLFQSVREKLGLCYSVYCYVSTYKNNGCFNIFTATNPANAQKAVETIKKELDLLKNKGVLQEELNRAREQVKSGLILSQESTTAIMNAYGKNMCMLGELFDIDERLAAVKSVTLDEVSQVIQSLFDYQKMCASFVGKNASCDIFDCFN